MENSCMVSQHILSRGSSLSLKKTLSLCPRSGLVPLAVGKWQQMKVTWWVCEFGVPCLYTLLRHQMLLWGTTLIVLQKCDVKHLPYSCPQKRWRWSCLYTVSTMCQSWPTILQCSPTLSRLLPSLLRSYWTVQLKWEVLYLQERICLSLIVTILWKVSSCVWSGSRSCGGWWGWAQSQSPTSMILSRCQQEDDPHSALPLYSPTSDILLEISHPNRDLHFDLHDANHIKFLIDISFQLTNQDYPQLLACASQLAYYQTEQIQQSSPNNTPWQVYGVLRTWLAGCSTKTILGALKDAFGICYYGNSI